VATLVVLVALFADGAFGILWNEIVEQIDWVFELLKQNSNNVADFNSCLLTVGFGGSSSSSTSSTVAFLEAVGGEAVVTSGFLLRFAAPGSRRVWGFDEVPPRAGTVFEESRSAIWKVFRKRS
jgi:hypothetical protein